MKKKSKIRPKNANVNDEFDFDLIEPNPTHIFVYLALQWTRARCVCVRVVGVRDRESERFIGAHPLPIHMLIRLEKYFSKSMLIVIYILPWQWFVVQPSLLVITTVLCVLKCHSPPNERERDSHYNSCWRHRRTNREKKTKTTHRRSNEIDAKCFHLSMISNRLYFVCWCASMRIKDDIVIVLSKQQRKKSR